MHAKPNDKYANFDKRKSLRITGSRLISKKYLFIY